MDAHVISVGYRACALLYHLGKVNASAHVGALHELEHYVALAGLWIKALVRLLVVVLFLNDRVLTHSDIKIILCTVHSESVNLESTGNPSVWQCVGMY